MAEVPGWPGRPPHGASSDDYTAIHDSVPVAHSGEPKGEDTRWTIPACSRCGHPLQPEGYDGDLQCPNAEYPNKTRHGSYHQVDLEVCPASALAQALEERDRLQEALEEIASRESVTIQGKGGDRVGVIRSYSEAVDIAREALSSGGTESA